MDEISVLLNTQFHECAGGSRELRRAPFTDWRNKPNIGHWPLQYHYREFDDRVTAKRVRAVASKGSPPRGCSVRVPV